MTNANPNITETWKSIPSWEHRYEASDQGRIRAIFSNRHGAYYVLRPRLSLQKYFRVQLSDRKRRQWFTVHSLIALTFIGPRPTGKQINHKNGCKTDNRPSNLEYVTASQNQIHAASIGLLHSGDEHWTRRLNHTLPRGEQRPNAKLKDDDVVTIKELLSAGVRHRDIAARFGIDTSLVSRINRGLTWTHIQ